MPAAVAVTLPDASTLAILLVVLHVPPAVASLNTVEPETQKVIVPLIVFAAIGASMVTVIVSLWLPQLLVVV